MNFVFVPQRYVLVEKVSLLKEIHGDVSLSLKAKSKVDVSAIVTEGECKWGKTPGGYLLLQKGEEVPCVDTAELFWKPSPKPEAAKGGDDQKADEEDSDESSGSVSVHSDGWDAKPWKTVEDHMLRKTIEVTDMVKLDDVHCKQLVELAEKLEFTESHKLCYKSMAVYMGSASASACEKKAIIQRLKTVTDFVEKEDAKMGEHTRKRARFITKTLLEDKENQFDPQGIVMMLASHGGVCNLMKETAVNDVYSMITNTWAARSEQESLDNTILQRLKAVRTIICEDMYNKTSKNNNTHYINGWKNSMAPKIGLDIIPDPNGKYPMSLKMEDALPKFMEQYTPERIVACIKAGIDLKPRAIKYDQVMDWMKENCPVKDSYSFLEAVFNMETGTIQPNYVKWMLMKMGILEGPEIKFTTVVTPEEV